MSDSIVITVLVENSVRRLGLMAEHGLAYWIETPRHRVLFDTGQSQLLTANAKRLGIDPAQADAIVLSHGHYDHTGGLPEALALAGGAQLFLHPKATITRYGGPSGKTRSNGLSSMTDEQIQALGDRLVWTNRPTQVVPSVFVTGEIPRQTSYEDTGGQFWLDSQGTQPDPILDDQAIYFDTAQGVVLVLGCAHSGIINTIEQVRQQTGRPIHAVIGGTHLLNASEDRLQRTIDELGRLNLRLLAPMHCTGPKAIAALWTAFPAQIADGSVGTRWTFPLA